MSSLYINEEQLVISFYYYSNFWADGVALDNIKLFGEKFISYKKSSSFSTPNRLIVLFEGLQKQIVLKSEEVKGPNVNAPEVALEGFMRSNSISKEDMFKKKIDKGEFYFFKTKSKKLNTQDLLEELVPLILQKIQWKKSMRWSDFSLNWGRPLKSILAIFDRKKLTFKASNSVKTKLN